MEHQRGEQLGEHETEEDFIDRTRERIDRALHHADEAEQSMAGTAEGEADEGGKPAG